jgi:hypothetical protein
MSPRLRLCSSRTRLKSLQILGQKCRCTLITIRGAVEMSVTRHGQQVWDVENAEPQEARRHLKLSEDGRTVSLEQDIKGGVFVCARAELVRGCARATVTVPKETATGDLDIGCVSADGTRAWLYLGRAGERVEQRRAQSQWVDASERVQCGAPLLPEDRVAMELDLLPAQPRLIFTLNGRALPGAAAPPRGCAARFVVRLHMQGERAELT